MLKKKKNNQISSFFLFTDINYLQIIENKIKIATQKVNKELSLKICCEIKHMFDMDNFIEHLNQIDYNLKFILTRISTYVETKKYTTSDIGALFLVVHNTTQSISFYIQKFNELSKGNFNKYLNYYLFNFTDDEGVLFFNAIHIVNSYLNQELMKRFLLIKNKSQEMKSLQKMK